MKCYPQYVVDVVVLLGKEKEEEMIVIVGVGVVVVVDVVAVVYAGSEHQPLHQQ